MDNFENTIEQYKRELMKYAKKNGTVYAENSAGFKQAAATEPQPVAAEPLYEAKYVSNRPMPAEYEGGEEALETVVTPEYAPTEQEATPNGLTNPNGITTPNGLTNPNRLINPNELTNSNGLANQNGLTNPNRLINPNGLSTPNGRETTTDQNAGETPIERRYRNYNDFISDNPRTGKLRVQAYAARQAFPVQNATVTVEKQFDEELRSFSETLTDIDGVSENIILPTKDKGLSQTPGGEIPYSTYTVRVEHPQFIPLVFYNVPIFDSIESLQPAAMLPNSGRMTAADIIRENEPKL